MATFNYCATFDESIAMLRVLCERGLRVIPGRTYEQPIAPEYSETTDELVALLKEGPGFYLAGNFTKFPVQLHKHRGGPAAGRYSIELLVQGPLLQGLLARCNVVNGVPTLLPGIIAHEDRYENPDTKTWERASADVKAAYRSIVTTMREHMVLNESGTFPFGPKALQLLREGKAQLHKSVLDMMA